jgi:glycosyltransferase involved in cell wall biosynthesis
MRAARPLKIALLAPAWERVPPTTYGGTELVVHNLAGALTRRGHDVTVFATGDSEVEAHLEWIHPQPGYRSGIAWANANFSLRHTLHAFERIRAGGFDLVHNHFGTWGIAFARLLDIRAVTTCHGDLSVPEKGHGLNFFSDLLPESDFVSISRAQARLSKFDLRWIGNVYNGIEVDRFDWTQEPETYFAWLGRFTPDKGALEAALAAREAGAELIMAGKVDRFVQGDLDYFEREVKPLLDGQRIRFIGEVDHPAKVALLKGARALLSPIRWNEPFGLVMPEAMACGTPVIAHGMGSVPEVVEHGVTGFVTSGQDDLVAAMARVGEIDRRACRERAERLFSAAAMARGYEEIFERVLDDERLPEPVAEILATTSPPLTG